MAFEVFKPKKKGAGRRQGSPKIRVEGLPNGNVRVYLSGAVRDWLGPTKASKNAQGRFIDPELSVRMLLDRENGKFAVQRTTDDDEDALKVRGLSGSQQAYFTQYGLFEDIADLAAGIYDAELKTVSVRKPLVDLTGDDGKSTTEYNYEQTAIAVITFGTQTQPQPRAPKAERADEDAEDDSGEDSESLQ